MDDVMPMCRHHLYRENGHGFHQVFTTRGIARRLGNTLERDHALKNVIVGYPASYPAKLSPAA
uniref:Uncharacterized protein n=1 Tax=Oryza meridionalis TaxID=40149 RepID=A0A0E0ESA4_9ORYZ